MSFISDKALNLNLINKQQHTILLYLETFFTFQNYFEVKSVNLEEFKNKIKEELGLRINVKDFEGLNKVFSSTCPLFIYFKVTNNQISFLFNPYFLVDNPYKF